MSRSRSRQSSLLLRLLALLVSVSILLPVCYLLWQAMGGDLYRKIPYYWGKMPLRSLLGDTLLLAGCVLVCSLLLAFPLAWWTSRYRIPGQRFFVLCGVLPLAIPSYLMAYAYLSLTGRRGLLDILFGWEISRPHGFFGALLVLTLCNFPYLFLNLRTALLSLDPSLEEAARSLGASRWERFRTILLPQLWPALWSGALLIVLHVLGNFEAVSLMRFKTLSWELYQYRMIDRAYSAWLSLGLLSITALLLLLEARFLRKLQLARTGLGSAREAKRQSLHGWTWPIVGLCAALVLLSLVVPVGTISYWFYDAASQSLLRQEASALWTASLHSLQSSGPAALLAVLLAIPLVRLSLRYPSRTSRFFEGVSYFGYAVPPIALALSLVFVCLRLFPSLHLSIPLLIYALTLHYLAEALGPIRSAMYQLPARLEESARALGRGPFLAFLSVTLPNLRQSIFVSAALVFLSSMKELPLNLIISPSGYSSLAMEVWDRIENVMYAEAAPYAMLILFFSALFVGCLLLRRKP